MFSGLIFCLLDMIVFVYSGEHTTISNMVQTWSGSSDESFVVAVGGMVTGMLVSHFTRF
jgi:hypothetical protein